MKLENTESMKLPHDIPLMFRRIRAAVEGYAKAAMFELADEGYNTPFEQLVACIISIRTYDEVMVKIARELFRHARTPQQMLELTVEQIDELIHGSTFHRPKAEQIREIAQRCMDEHGGDLPCHEGVLRSFRGVGPKCTNLVMGIACDARKIGVDIHVHRVTNRWGYVAARSPEKTLLALEGKLPPRYRVEINRLLVPFGKHICTGTLPKCSTYPVLDMCWQVGVDRHR